LLFLRILKSDSSSNLKKIDESIIKIIVIAPLVAVFGSLIGLRFGVIALIGLQ